MASQQQLPSPAEIWRRYDRMEVRLAAPLTRRMLALAELRPGMRVLDLATGRGEPAIPAAHEVLPDGSVVGVDSSAVILELARERADQEGVLNLDLRSQDAAAFNARAAGPFDAGLCRWGLMYMDAPLAALKAVREGLKAGAPFVLAVWAEPERVPYFHFPRQVLRRHGPVPDVDFSGPGVFRYAHLHALEADLSAAGFRVAHVEELDVPVMEARDGPELVAWVRAFGLTRLLNGLPLAVQQAFEEDLVRSAEPMRHDGVVRLGGVTRIVVAR